MGRDGKDRGKIFKMDIGSGFEDARLYMVRKELQREKLRKRAGMRAWGV